MVKKKLDENEMAFGVVQRATQSDQPTHKDLISKIMTEMGRKGGKKGGVERAKKLSPERKTEIAKKAAQERWKDKPSQQ